MTRSHLPAAARSSSRLPTRDALGVARREERGGLGLERLVQAALRERVAVARLFAVGGDDVEQQDLEAGAGEVRGDAAAHDAGAEHCDLLELSHVCGSS